MESYIGAKIIRAEPMAEFEFLRQKDPHQPLPDREQREGYKVVYPDGYVSWSPKAVFEEAYRPISEGEKRLI